MCRIGSFIRIHAQIMGQLKLLWKLIGMELVHEQLSRASVLRKKRIILYDVASVLKVQMYRTRKCPVASC